MLKSVWAGLGRWSLDALIRSRDLAWRVVKRFVIRVVVLTLVISDVIP